MRLLERPFHAAWCAAARWHDVLELDQRDSAAHCVLPAAASVRNCLLAALNVWIVAALRTDRVALAVYAKLVDNVVDVENVPCVVFRQFSFGLAWDGALERHHGATHAHLNAFRIYERILF